MRKPWHYHKDDIQGFIKVHGELDTEWISECLDICAQAWIARQKEYGVKL